MKGNVCEKRWKKALCGILSAVTLLPAMGVPALAEGYDNIYENVCQINSFIAEGLYVEAIQECDQTKAWHVLSQDDIGILDGLKAQAQAKYDDYIYSLNTTYDDISANVNQINSFIVEGLYVEAMQECEQTKAWHNLSLADKSLLDNLKCQAQVKYDEYVQQENQAEIKNKVRAVVSKYVASMKNPSSAHLYSVYAGDYERSKYNSSASGQAFGVVINIAGQNSFGGTTRTSVALMVDSYGNVIDLKSTGESQSRYYETKAEYGWGASQVEALRKQIEGLALVDEALNLIKYAPSVFTSFDVSSIL